MRGHVRARHPDRADGDVPPLGPAVDRRARAVPGAELAGPAAGPGRRTAMLRPPGRYPRRGRAAPGHGPPEGLDRPGGGEDAAPSRLRLGLLRGGRLGSARPWPTPSSLATNGSANLLLKP